VLAVHVLAGVIILRADVDGDGVKEMITGGSSYNYFPTAAGHLDMPS